MVVALGATLAAAGFSSHIQSVRGNSRKAEMLISQIERLKQNLSIAIACGETSAPLNESALAARILPSIRVQGLTLVGNQQADANTLGFFDLSIGSLDVVDSNGKIISHGNTASITLNDGTVITSESR